MKKIKDNRRGSTLVEVIVTFALIGMFLLAATTAVSAAMNAFYRMESLSRAIVVSDTILDKAQGELSLASADGALLCLGGESSGDDWWKTICFYSANGNPVRMESDTDRRHRNPHREPIPVTDPPHMPEAPRSLPSWQHTGRLPAL